jgi:hypothetical protein
MLQTADGSPVCLSAYVNKTGLLAAAAYDSITITQTTAVAAEPVSAKMKVCMAGQLPTHQHILQLKDASSMARDVTTT